MTDQHPPPVSENDELVPRGRGPSATVAPFVGAERQRLVGALVERFERCRDTAIPCWVSIEGAAGTGKTRLVHETYARLAAAQGARPYWPARLEEGVQSAATPVRKRVAPVWTGSPGGVPSWFWWGLRGLSQDGDPIAMLAADLEQFTEHDAPLEEAWRRRASIGRRLLGTLPKAAVAAGEEGAVEGAAQVAGRVASLVTDGAVESILGVGAAVRAARTVSAQRRGTRARHEAVRLGVPIVGRPSTDPADIAVDLIGRVAYDGTVPVVVFVEDLHEADEILVELIERLLRFERRAVLIITTSATGALEADERFAALLSQRRESGSDACFRWIGEGEPPVPAAQVLGELASLSLADRERIVRHAAPGIAPSATAALVERYNRPLLLEMVSSDQELAELYGSDLAGMTTVEVAELPADVDSYLRRAFDRLPKRTREVLRTAAAALPHLIDPNSSSPALDGRRDFLLSALDEWNPSSADGVHDWPASLEAWLDLSDPLRYSFREWSELDVIAHPPLRAAVIERLRGALARRAIAFFAGASVEENTDYPERLVMALHESAHLSERSTIRAATLRRLYRLSGSARESGEALRIGELYLEHADDQASPESLIVRNNLAMVRASRGETGRAIAELEAVVEILLREPSPLPIDRLTMLANLGDMMLRAELASQAFPVLHGALDSHEKVFGATDSRTLWLRARWAVCAIQLGHADRGRAELEQTLVVVSREFDPHDPLVFSIREDLLGVRRQTEPPERLIADHQALADDIVEAFGSEHHNALGARQTTAVLRGEVGDLGRAFEESNEIYKIRTRVLGPLHPSTLNSLHNAVSMLGEMGQYSEAASKATTLMRLQSRALDRDHPNTLATRHNVGVWAANSGKPLAGVVDLHAVWRAFAQGSGEDAPRTLRVAAHVARCLVVGGYGDSGRALLLDVVARMRDVFPSDHPSLSEVQGWLDERPS